MSGYHPPYPPAYSPSQPQQPYPNDPFFSDQPPTNFNQNFPSSPPPPYSPTQYQPFNDGNYPPTQPQNLPYGITPNQPFNQSQNLPYGVTPNESFNQPQNQPFNQPPNNQPFNQPPNQPFNQPPNQPFNQPPNQPFNHPPNQPFNQPQDQPFNQPQNQPYNKQDQNEAFNQPPNQTFNPTAAPDNISQPYNNQAQNSSDSSSTYPTIPPVPQRPAPPAPGPQQQTLGFEDSTDSNGAEKRGAPTYSPSVPSNPATPWQDTPLPPNLRELWQCGDCRGIYFLQEDGSIVAPSSVRLNLKLYINDGFDFSKCPSRRSSTSSTRSESPGPGTLSTRSSPLRTVPEAQSSLGFSKPQTRAPVQYSMMLECPGVFRIKLSPVRGHVFITSAKDFVGVVDMGTYPCRSVIIQMPRDIDQTYLQKMLNLFEEYAILTTETGGVINTVTSTVHTAFNTASKKSSGLLKDTTPGLHKSTKFLRKGTGSIARLGGSLVNKGMNFIGETVAPTPQEEKMQEFDPRVNQLKSAISAVKDAIAKKTFTSVTAPRGL